MREIKFRQPIFSNGVFVKFHYWGFISEGCFVGPLTSEFIRESQQDTGLLDKNGKGIYEGDFIKCGWYVAPIDVHKTQIIMLDDIRDIFLKLPIEGFRNYAGVEYEIIGNIYENPDLLSKPQQ